MTKEIGRTENKARYEKCVEEFKRSFAEYRAAFEADTKEMLVWSGEYYKLKENGEFELLSENDKNNIRHLEKDVAAFWEFVNGSLLDVDKEDEEDEEEDEETDIDTLVIVKDCIEKNVPSMKCFMLDIIKDDLYWITNNKFTFEDVNAFVEYVRRVFPYKTLWIIPKEFSTLDFEKDKKSKYMVSIEEADEKSEVTLPSVLSRLITMMRSLGVQEGIFKIDGIAIAVLTDSPMKFDIRYNSTEIAVTLNERTHRATYHCKSPSKKENVTDTTYITKALGKYCKDYDESNYEIVDIRNAEISREDSDALLRLFVEILNS